MKTLLAETTLGNVQTNIPFTFVGDSPTDYDRVFRVVVPPIQDTPPSNVLFGIAYQPTRDSNSVYIVHVASGKLYRALASHKVRPRTDVTTTLLITDPLRY